MDKCTCGRYIVDPIGLKTAKLLIVGDRPDYEDLQKNMPFLSKRGDVLREELGMVGLDIRSCRLTFLWRHDIVKDCKPHMSDVLREMVDRPFVLLMGAETLKAFNIEHSDLKTGLQVTSVFIPETTIAYVVTNPPQNSAVGEFRLALKKLKRRMYEA